MKTPFFLLVILCGLCSSLEAQTRPRCLYVTADKANLYQNESKKSILVHRLQYGDLVRVSDSVPEYILAQMGKKSAKSHWLKVTVPGSEFEGYIQSNNTGFYLPKLPERFLTTYNEIVLENGLIITKGSTRYNYYRTQGEINTDTAACGCFDYNEQLPAAIRSADYITETIPLTTGDTLQNALPYFLEITEVDIDKYTKKKINNPYEITAGPMPVYAPDSGGNGEGLYRFYLLLDAGKDSVLVNETAGEYGAHYNYAGQIERYNKYLLEHESFFSQRYILIDKTSGYETEFTSGLPHISPNGKLVVDFYESFDAELEEIYGTPVAISAMDSSGVLTNKIIVLFRSFLPDESFQSFWVSDTELIMRVYPIDNFIYLACTGQPAETSKFQYLKIKALKY